MVPPNCLTIIAVRKIKTDFKMNLAQFKFIYSEKATKIWRNLQKKIDATK